MQPDPNPAIPPAVSDTEHLHKILLYLDEQQLEELFFALRAQPAFADALRAKLRALRGDWQEKDLETLIREQMDRSTGRMRKFFSELSCYVDRAKMTDSQVYNQVGMDRKLWYRLRDRENARTHKDNVLKMCIVLHLDYWETYYLVSLSGYSFMPSPDISRTDYGIGLCVSNGIYDPEQVDALLVKLGEPALFAK